MTSLKKKQYILISCSILILYIFIVTLSSMGFLNRYSKTILNLVMIYVILASSLNVTVGNMGQITLGHAGFMSIGAYTAAIFMKSVFIPGMCGYFISLILAGLVAGFFGILIAIPVLRLKGDYLAIVTLAFGEIIRVLIENMSITGGAQGITGIPTMKNFTVIYLITCISVAMIYSVMTSRHGRSVLAIHDNEIAAESSGINVTYQKTWAFTLSAFFAGLAGAIYAQNIGVLSADIFDYNTSFNILVMVVLGGMGSFTGSILAAIVLTIIPELLRSFSGMRMIIYSIILILVMIFRPKGLMGREEFSISKFFPIFLRENLKTNNENKENGEDKNV